MSRTFRRHGDLVRMELTAVEAELLFQLREGLADTLRRGAPDDPAVARLFPPAVSGDEEADAELRRLLFDDLLASKLAGLDELVALVEAGTSARGRRRIDLTPEQAGLVLGVLNDLRLAIGARVGIDTIDRSSFDESDERAPSVALIDHFAWWQEQLLAILDPASVAHYERD